MILLRDKLIIRRRLFTAAVVIAVLVQQATPAMAAPPASSGQPQSSAAPAATAASEVKPEERNDVLGAGWRMSDDRMWTTAGDASGFHLLVAEQSTGYQWRTAATLKVPGIETDAWVWLGLGWPAAGWSVGRAHCRTG